MPKAVFKIAEFEGGENRVANPRDLELNESAFAIGVEFDNIGRVRIAGNGVDITSKLGDDGFRLYTFGENNKKLVPGYGLFPFSHDFNMDNSGDGTNPQEVDTNFIAFSYYGDSGIYVGFIDENYDEASAYSGVPRLTPLSTHISLMVGVPSNDPKITFFYADAGLRISDGEFKNVAIDGNEYLSNVWYGHVKRTLFSKLTIPYTIDTWLQDNQSLEKTATLTGDSNIKTGRPYENTDTILDASLQYYTALGTNYALDEEEVRLEIAEDTSARRTIASSLAEAGLGTTVITTSAAHGFTTGDMVEIYGASGIIAGYNGQYEVVSGVSTDSYFTISLDTEALGEFDEFSGTTEYVIPVESMINPELRKQWIFGISFVFDDGQETQIAVANNDGTGGTMGSANPHDWRTFIGEPKMRFAFAHSNDTYSASTIWHHRITGFRLYQKDIEGSTTEDATQEWHLMTDVDFIKGQYVLPGRDSTEILLVNNSYRNYANHHDGTSAFDDLRFLSPITYESLNGYTASETITARYKTAVVANERCYIGNIEQDNQRFPDRIIRSPIGAYDVYPESFFLDSVFSDGDEIVKLEEFSDRILCFKRNTLYIINISSEEEYLEDVFPGYGIEEPHQAVKTQHGVVFINSSGLHLYSGEGEITNLTATKRKPWEFEVEGKRFPLGFYFKGAIPTLGYDRVSDKIIVLRASRAIDFTVTIGNDTETITTSFATGGVLYTANGGKRPDVGDVFQVTGSYDFTGNELGLAKYGSKGITGVRSSDIFIVTNNYVGSETVKYLDLDSDVLIYDMANNAISYRNFSFGSNDIGYNKTNFIYTTIFGESKLLLLKDASGTTQDGSNIDIIEWEDGSQDIAATYFKYMTRDIDLGNPSVRKKIYKVYVTFRTNDGLGAHGNSNVRVYYLENQNTETYEFTIDDWTEFDSTSSTNYSSSNGLYSEGDDSDWQLAELKPSSSINNIYSIQLLFHNAGGIVPLGFEINDISIVYRQKPVK